MLVDDFRLPARWAINRSDESVALFQNAVGDTLSVNHFRLKPDIAADIADAGALRAFYRSAAEANGLAMLEVDPIQVANLPAVRTLLKARLQPRGFAFIGSVTIPFADSSYVLKAQSVERGATGLRESVVMAAQKQPPKIDSETGKLLDWEQDPYDPAHRASFMRNRADGQEFDGQFPDHPLTKVRVYINELINELGVGASIQKLAPFRYEPSRPGFWSRILK